MCFTAFNPKYMRQFNAGFSMVSCMAVMIAINVGVMVYKSILESRRQSKLKAIKKRKFEKYNFEIEVKVANDPFSMTAGMAEANKKWR
jgi:hypothetical protein